jgi:murein DD-endopeptidase MepM/ murein hydrolase activator NlpD
VVTATGSILGYGTYACMAHRFPKGIMGVTMITTCYGYLARTDAKPGDLIRRGETVGVSGCSGPCTSPRVHFVVRLGPWEDSRTTDPAPFLADKGTS